MHFVSNPTASYQERHIYLTVDILGWGRRGSLNRAESFKLGHLIHDAATYPPGRPTGVCACRLALRDPALPGTGRTWLWESHERWRGQGTVGAEDVEFLGGHDVVASEICLVLLHHGIHGVHVGIHGQTGHVSDLPLHRHGIHEVGVVRCSIRRKEETIAGLVLMLELVVLRCDIAKGGLAGARAGYALLLRFSQYMLWCC